VEERRSEARVVLRRRVEVVSDAGVGQWAYTANLSRRGVLVELGQVPALGAMLKLRLTLSEGDPLEVRGRVRHATPMSLQGPHGNAAYHLVGVQFERLSDSAERIIADTVEAAEREEI
jgi:hypothetical protein